MTSSFLAASSPFMENLVHLSGFLLVVLVLIVLWAITVLIGRVSNLWPAKPAAAPAAAPAVSPGPDTQAMAGEEELSDEEVIAITASVAALLGRDSKIVSIQPLHRDWSREGRREHFASHRIR